MSFDPAPPSDVAAAPAGAESSPSGLRWVHLCPGAGDPPSATAKVTVHYSGWTTDGALFDSSRARNSPASFPLNRVIKGWTEGLQRMRIGGSTRFWIPAELAYGTNPAGGRPAGMLVFDVELLAIEEPPAPPAVPEDVAAVPKGASTTASGLAWRSLSPGAGTRHPGPTSKVTVHYTGWTTDGKQFDSSVVRGQPATFPLNGVIAGWTEGLQLMVEGETARFWIPAAMAYGENPGGGRPGGMLVFDVSLLSIA